eukprot:COSAG06_NODE_17570_length_933_cov_2.075540_2_plen_31_part_01
MYYVSCSHVLCPQLRSSTCCGRRSSLLVLGL